MKMVKLEFVITVATWLFYAVYGKQTKYIDMPSKYCGSASREIDGAVVRSGTPLSYTATSCVMKFLADESKYTDKKFMFRFEQMKITDCSLKLYIYHHKDAIGQPNMVIDCNSENPGIQSTNGKYLTLKLEKNTNTGYDFTMVITSFEERSFCSNYPCHNGKCVDEGLMCDSVDNCFDNSDEKMCISKGHVGSEPATVGLLSMGAIIGIVVAIIVVMIVVSIIIVVVIKQRRSRYREVVRTPTPAAAAYRNHLHHHHKPISA